ncbi:hypothetical protein [Actinopolyspora saharensis]|uniref:hypothetical protein n=1 Tax=Actinopolyspora saharensis TaxID=995062 RepID=UPI000B82F9FE|nr:hypothetical protein [Actinopolyspora saharensis]
MLDAETALGGGHATTEQAALVERELARRRNQEHARAYRRTFDQGAPEERNTDHEGRTGS